MIVVTRLNGTQFAVNPDLIERVEAVPDTTLIMVGHARYIVTESLQEVLEMVADYRAEVISRARELPKHIRPVETPTSGRLQAAPPTPPTPLRPRNP